MLKSLAFFMICVAASPAYASDITAVSEISAVTVFPDRANIERTAKITLPAGKHTVVFDDLPSGLISESVRVSGKGKKKFTIGSVETKRIFQTDPAVASERKMQDELTRLRDKRRYLEADIRAADTGKAFLEGLSRAPQTPLSDKSEAREQSSPDTWKKGWETLQSGMKTLGREIIEKQIELRSLDSEISALQQKLSQSATGRKSTKQIRINVESAMDNNAELVLQYQIFGASWQPLYEARLDSKAQKTTLTQFGNISQKTGEDWNNVALTLSTATPSVQMTPPVLTTKWLNLKTNIPVPVRRSARVKMKAMGRAAVSNFAAMDTVDGAVQESVSFDAEELEDAAVEQAVVAATEFSGVFVVKGLSNVPADGAEYRFTIGDYVSKAEIRAETMPASDPSAYLIATTVYDGELPLLAGRMALYRDGAFIGTSSMEMLRPNEKLHLSFGQDDKIRVKFTSLGGEKTEGGVINKETKIDTLARFEVQNLHDMPLKISVYDSLPVARDADITVSVLKNKTTAGYVESPNNKVGTIMWEGTYAPRQKKTIDFGYSVSYPKDRILTGM